MKFRSLFTLLVIVLSIVSARRLRKRTSLRRKEIEHSKKQHDMFEKTMESKGFTLKKRIAGGGFGVVYEVTENNHSLAAKGVFYRGEKGSERWNYDKTSSINEIKQHEMVSDLPFVMPLCDSFPINKDDGEVGKVFLMPKATKESLYDVSIHFYNEDDFMSKEKYLMPFLMAATTAVAGLHEKKIIHSDIKLQNFAIYEPKIDSETIPTPLLIDFGAASTEEKKIDPKYKFESPLMTAPDVIDGVYHISLKNDIYSLGMVFGMLTLDWMVDFYDSLDVEDGDYKDLKKHCLALSEKCFSGLKIFGNLDLKNMETDIKFNKHLKELFTFILDRMLCKPELRADIEEVKHKMTYFIRKVGNPEENKRLFNLMEKASKKAKEDCSH